MCATLFPQQIPIFAEEGAAHFISTPEEWKKLSLTELGKLYQRARKYHQRLDAHALRLGNEKTAIEEEMQAVEASLFSLSGYMQTVPPQTLADSMVMLTLAVEALEIENNIAVKQLILVAQQVIANHADGG